MSLYRYLSSEGRFHYNTEEEDFSNLLHIDLTPIPPTFITYDIKVTQTYNPEEIREYVLAMFNDKTEEFTTELVELTTATLQAHMDLSIKEAVELALAELTSVYGGSASDVMDEGGPE